MRKSNARKKERYFMSQLGAPETSPATPQSTHVAARTHTNDDHRARSAHALPRLGAMGGLLATLRCSNVGGAADVMECIRHRDAETLGTAVRPGLVHVLSFLGVVPVWVPPCAPAAGVAHKCPVGGPVGGHRRVFGRVIAPKHRSFGDE